VLLNKFLEGPWRYCVRKMSYFKQGTLYSGGAKVEEGRAQPHALSKAVKKTHVIGPKTPSSKRKLREAGDRVGRLSRRVTSSL